MLILLMLGIATTAVGGPLAFDDFNSYSAGSNLLDQDNWSELFSSDDPAVSATEAYAGMGNSVVGLNEGNYASAKMLLAKGAVDLGTDEVYVTGLLSLDTLSNPANDDGLYIGFANSNADKLEIRFMGSRNDIVITGTGLGYSTYNLDPNTLEEGKTYLCVAKCTPETATTFTVNAGVVEFTGYPLAIPEITYQVTKTGVAPTAGVDFGSALWFPRGVGHYVDHAFAGETWADVQSPSAYVPPYFPPQLMAYYPMDQGKGTLAPDFANDNDATATGDVVWTHGQIGAAANMNGQYFNIPSIDQMQMATGLTISAWLNTSALNSGYKGAVFTRDVTDASGTGQNYGIAMEGDTRFEVRASGSGVDGPSNVEADRWYHVVQLYDSSAGTTTLIVDNQIVAGPTTNADIAAGGTIISSGSWQLGNDVAIGGRIWPGLIDDVAIWNYVLDPNDIEDLYENGLIGIGADGNTPSLPPEIAPKNWIDPQTLDSDDVIFSKEPGLGNGGFEDLFDYVEDHPDNDADPYSEPFRIFCEGLTTDPGDGNVNPLDNPNGNWCTIDDGGWTASIVWQGWTGNPAGWETPMYNPGYPERQYEGESHFLIQVTQDVLLESDYQVDATMIADGDNLVVEWFSYMGGGTADITPSLVFDKGTGGEWEVELDTVVESAGEYTKRTSNYVMVGTASTLDVKLLLDSNSGQLRIDNVQVTRSPYYEIDEDPTNNVANVPIKLLSDPGETVTLNVSTWSDEEAVVKYTTDNHLWSYMDDLDVTEVTFTGGGGGNWNVEQDIVITSTGNSTIEGDRTMIFKVADPNSAADPNIVPSVDYFTVKVIDDEFPRLEVVDPNVIVGEHGNGPNGQSDTFKVKLGGTSSSNVQVNFVDEGDPDEVTVTGSVEFTPLEIATGVEKTVTVTALDDGAPEALLHGTVISISASAVAGDPSPDTDYIDNFPVGTTVDVIIYDADCGSDGHVSQILDVTGDCYVTMADFAELAARWLECYIPNGSNAAGDCIATH